NYWHHKRLAQRTKIALRSPVMDGMPKSPSYGNKAEEKLVSHADELYYLNACDDYRTILWETYIISPSKRLTNDAIVAKLKMERSAFYIARNRALYAFAELCPLVSLVKKQSGHFVD
uniref:transcriptional regulator n=1 Tax=Lacticaseibacillus paracasei TaxID=1597 RepID=UPI0022E71231